MLRSRAQDAKEAKQEHGQEATAGSGGSYNTKGSGLVNGTKSSGAPRSTLARVRLSMSNIAIPAGGWWYPTAAVRTTVSMPQLGICDDSAPDGVTNQGNKEGEWFWCDSRLQVS